MGQDRDAQRGVVADRFGALVSVARALGTAIHPDRVLGIVLDQLAAVVGHDGGQIWLVEKGLLRLAASRPSLETGIQGLELDTGSGLLGGVAARRRGVVCDDAARDPRVGPGHRRICEDIGVGSLAAVPLMATGELVGVFVLHSDRLSAFHRDDLVFLEAIGVQVGSALESARRFAQVMELERLKADFIARISHELRTPITIISGFLTTMLQHDGVIDPESRRHMLERSQSAADRLASLIGDLLTLSRIETGVLRAERKRIDLRALIGEIAAHYEPGAVVVAAPGPDRRLLGPRTPHPGDRTRGRQCRQVRRAGRGDRESRDQGQLAGRGAATAGLASPRMCARWSSRCSHAGPRRPASPASASGWRWRGPSSAHSVATSSSGTRAVPAHYPDLHLAVVSARPDPGRG